MTGSALQAGDTTAQKITKVNSWTVTGTIPTTIFVSGSQIFNCVNYSEFKALTATQQSNLLLALAGSGQLLGGSSNTTHLLVGMILDFFPVAGPTIAALTALAQASVTPWWQVGAGLSGPVSLSDTQKAGLS